MGELIEIATAIRKDSLRKAQRVVIDRQLTKFINQISATMQQISKKTQEILRYLESHAGPGGGGGGEWRTYAMVVLASKMVGQCEGQVSSSGRRPGKTISSMMSIKTRGLFFPLSFPHHSRISKLHDCLVSAGLSHQSLH